MLPKFQSYQLILTCSSLQSLPQTNPCSSSKPMSKSNILIVHTLCPSPSTIELVLSNRFDHQVQLSSILCMFIFIDWTWIMPELVAWNVLTYIYLYRNLNWWVSNGQDILLESNQWSRLDLSCPSSLFESVSMATITVDWCRASNMLRTSRLESRPEFHDFQLMIMISRFLSKSSINQCTYSSSVLSSSKLNRLNPDRNHRQPQWMY